MTMGEPAVKYPARTITTLYWTWGGCILRLLWNPGGWLKSRQSYHLPQATVHLSLRFDFSCFPVASAGFIVFPFARLGSKGFPGCYLGIPAIMPTSGYML
jgi:hypothetical protein